MKTCPNCSEPNSDGASECVICGDKLEISQVALSATPSTVEQVVSEQVVSELSEIGAVEEVQTLKGTEPPVPPPLPPPTETPPEPPKEEPQSAEQFEEAKTIPMASAQEPEPIIQEPVTPAPTPPEPTIQEPFIPEPAPTISTSKNIVLLVYHDTEARVVHTHRVLNNITLIGREDPQRDIFPDLDLGKLASAGVSASCASRQHLRLIRQGNDFFLFIYKGTTGTQVNKDIIDESRYGRRFPVAIGDRIIIGGKIRLKLCLAD